MWTILRAILAYYRLNTAAHELGDIDKPELVEPFVEAALAEETANAPATLLVALGWGESRYDPAAAPACGAMQVYPNDLGEPASRCAEWRADLRAGVRAGVREIEVMLADKRVAGNLRLALLYRACGNSAFDGTCKRDRPDKYVWVNLALARYHDIDAKVHGRAVPRS